MVALLCFFRTLLTSPFQSRSQLEAENAPLRQQLIILQRKVRGRVHFTNSDRRGLPNGHPVWINHGGAGFTHDITSGLFAGVCTEN